MSLKKTYVPKTVIYTTVFGNYDRLHRPTHLTHIQKQADLVCFTDSKDLFSRDFKIIRVNRKFKDPKKENRYYKLNPHLVFRDHPYLYNIYMDANCLIKANEIDGLLNRVLSNDLCHIALLKHPYHSCVYKEAETCILLKKDEETVIRRQMENYRREGYPQDYGLAASTYLFRKFSQENIDFHRGWWKEIMKGSVMDQLAFNYTQWKLGFSPIQVLDWNWLENDWGRLFPHQPHTKPYGTIKKHFHRFRRKLFG